MNSTPDAPELPPLPEPLHRGEQAHDFPPSLFDAEQMRAYARAALAARQPEPVAWHHTDFGVLELSRVQRPGWKPLYAQPPAELKDAQDARRWRIAKQLAPHLLCQIAWRVKAACTDEVANDPDKAIDAAMLSSAPTGASDV